MAYATQMTISTGNKVSLNYQSQEVSVTLTYQLEREDSDLLHVVREKTMELAQAHQAAWQTLRDAKVSALQEQTKAVPETPTAEEVTGMKAEPEEAEQEKAGSRSMQPAISPMVSVPSTQLADEPSQLLGQQLPEQQLLAQSMSPVERISPAQLAALLLLLTEAGWSEDRRQDYLRKQCSCCSVDDLTAPQAAQWLLELQRAERVAGQSAAQQRRLEKEKIHHNGTP